MSPQNESRQFSIYPELNDIPILDWGNFSRLSIGDVKNAIDDLGVFLDSKSNGKEFTSEQLEEINRVTRLTCQNLLRLDQIIEKGPKCISYSYSSLAGDLRKKLRLINETRRI